MSTSCFVPKQGKEPVLTKEMRKWKFPRNEIDVFEFLSRYAGVALQELHLPVMSKNIMDVLRQNCPNIYTMTYRHDHDEYPHLDKFVVAAGDMVKDIFYLPNNLRSIYLQAPSIMIRRSSNPLCTIESFGNDETTTSFRCVCENILNLLSQCKGLNKLTLKGFWLSLSGMRILTTNTDLKVIDIISCIPDGITFDRSRYLRDDIEQPMDKLLTSTIGSLQCLERFRLIGLGTIINIAKSRYGYLDKLSSLLRCICQWKHLKVLALKYVNLEFGSIFNASIPELTHLKSLELEGEHTTSDTVTLIGTQLKKLEFSALQNGRYHIESCLQPLSGHPTLRTLWILYDYEFGLIGGAYFIRFGKVDYCQSIYSVLVTLPKIKNVVLRGYNMSHLYTINDSYPGLESVEIEIQDMTIQDPHECDSRMQYPFENEIG